MQEATREVMELIDTNRPSMRDDEKLHVKFFDYAEYQMRKSEGYLDETGRTIPGAGRKLYENKTYVQIIPPGDGAHNVVERAVLPSDKIRFHKQWERFQAGHAQEHANGTPIVMLTQTVPAIMNVAQVEELKYLKIHTIEQFVAAPDGNAPIMSFQELKRKARDFLELQKSNAPLESMRSELSIRDGQIEAMKKQMTEQAEAIAELRKQKK